MMHQFLQLSQVKVASLLTIYLSQNVPEDLNLLLLRFNLIAELINHGLVLSAQVAQTHLADINGGPNLTRIEGRIGSKVGPGSLFKHHLSFQTSNLSIQALIALF